MTNPVRLPFTYLLYIREIGQNRAQH